MRKILLLLLMLPIYLCAQETAAYKIPLLSKKSFADQGSVYFSDKWKYHFGNDSSWASTTYNDTTWGLSTTIFDEETIKGFKKKGFTGACWFRKDIVVDSSLVGEPMALVLQNDGATAIYIDGEFIEKFGTFKSSGKSVYINPQRYPISYNFKHAGRHVIAVRFENFDDINKSLFNPSDGCGFLLQVSTAKSAIQEFHSQTVTTSILLLSMGCIFGALGFIHFLLFFFYKKGRSNFFFGLFNISIAILFICSYAGMNISSIKIQNIILWILSTSLFLACYSLSAFVNNLFPKPKWSHYIVILIGLLYLPSLLFESYSDYPAYSLVSFTSVEAIVLIILAIRKKVPGAKILASGILFFFAFIITMLLIGLFSNSLSFQLKGVMGFVIILVLFLAIFSIPLSITVYLSWSYSLVNKNLGMQLEHVEQLSQKTLQQEQEKQQLLEGRKEELEKEVAQRTTEVMHQKEQIEHQHEALKKEKRKSDELLLNILPAEVAEELKEKGESKAQLFDHVSVLFTDFVNFTQISERLGAEELVTELHECFRAFDAIMEQNGLEKIKTIGDAYLAVSGMPVYNEKHAYNAVKAAIEIIEFISNRNKQGHDFEIRIGIHSGPLIAGIVGVKKFAYDIWGDTVNTASRMESNSEAGKINISEATHMLVAENFDFTYRGKIDAKNKGAIDMYFVDGEK